MRFASGCAAISVLVASAAIGAGDPLKPLPPTITPAPGVEEKAGPAIEQLIKDLGSEDYRTREKAGRELFAKGEKVLPNLRTALAATDSPEVHRRLVVMIRKMEYDHLVAPRMIKLSLKDKTVKEVLAEISRQTGYKIEYQGDASGNVKHNFEFDNIPFWQAMDKVMTASGCDIANDNGDETIRVFNQGDSGNPYVSYKGPFRFVASNINSNINVQLAGINRRGVGVARQEFINFNFEIQSEPKNPMLGIAQIDVTAAVDENGGSLMPPRDPNFRVNFYNPNNNIMRGHSTYGSLNLSRRDKTATTIKSLKGKVGVILLSGTAAEVTVTDPLKVKNKSFTGRTVEIEFGSFTEVANNKGHYQLELTAKRLGTENNQNPNEDFMWSNSFWQKIEVVDSAGNRYQTYGPSSMDNGGATVQLTIPFGPEDRRGQKVKLGAPVKVLVNEWISVVNEVTFEFKDVPLP